MNFISIANTVRKNISAIREGEVFNYNRFTINQNKEQAVIKELSRLAKNGTIVRIEKGKYYKPLQTRFGILRPEENEIIKMVTKKGKQQIGYLSGAAMYNRMGLTTQVSNVLIIARNGRLPAKKINGYKVKFVSQPIKINQKVVPFLQLLDAVKEIKDIPDTSVDKSIDVLVLKLKSLSVEELRQLIRLSLKYNPATRALLGAIVENYFSSVNLAALKKTLNPLTKYKIGATAQTLPNLDNWNIK